MKKRGPGCRFFVKGTYAKLDDLKDVRNVARAFAERV